MIIDYILLALIALGEFFIGLIPKIQAFADMSFLGLAPVLSTASCILPVGTVFLALGIWLLFANVDITLQVIKWILSKFGLG